MYDVVLFDLDGTLTDSGEGIVNSVEYALEKMNIQVENRELLYKFVGPPLKESFRKYFNVEDTDLGVKLYREYFVQKGMFENSVYDGVREVLAELKKAGKKLVVATSKPEEFSVKILKFFDLYDFFDVVAGASLDETRTKKADVIRYALEKISVNNVKKIVMVGDRENDIMGAKENKLDSIGVLYGYGDLEELTAAGATYIAKEPADIVQYIV